jgi:hypothetical protein
MLQPPSLTVQDWQPLVLQTIPLEHDVPVQSVCWRTAGLLFTLAV